jgi:hypothetical protein
MFQKSFGVGEEYTPISANESHYHENLGLGQNISAYGTDRQETRVIHDPVTASLLFAENQENPRQP